MIIILSLAFTIFYLITLWKFAVKTGNPGWSLYIPIYSNFVWCNIARMDTIWCIMSFVPGIVLKMYPANFNIYILCGIFSTIIHFVFCRSIAERFGKGIGYTLGLFFLNPIFLAIITFNKRCIYRNYY